MILIWTEEVEGVVLGDPGEKLYQYEIHLHEYNMGLKTWVSDPVLPVRATLMMNGQSYFLSLVDSSDRVLGQSWRKM